MGRILAIDYGRKRCGLAVSDPLQLIANPLSGIRTVDLMEFLKDYCIREKVETLVVGYPLTLGNEASEALVHLNPFLKKLKKEFPAIPIVQVDERFTSKMAFQAMIDGGVKKSQRRDKALIDKVSAVIILQSYMESKHE